MIYVCKTRFIFPNESHNDDVSRSSVGRSRIINCCGFAIELERKDVRKNTEVLGKYPHKIIEEPTPIGTREFSVHSRKSSDFSMLFGRLFGNDFAWLVGP